MFREKSIRKHLIFSGRVQGVGFRYRAMHIAQILGLTGWVKNRWDGKVEMEVQGKREEIGKMKGRTADAAFLPLDPRLGQYFWLGIDDFMKEADARFIFPMHFWGEYDVAERLKALPCSEPYRDRIVEIDREGQCFEIGRCGE